MMHATSKSYSKHGALSRGFKAGRSKRKEYKLCLMTEKMLQKRKKKKYNFFEKRG